MAFDGLLGRIEEAIIDARLLIVVFFNIFLGLKNGIPVGSVAFQAFQSEPGESFPGSIQLIYWARLPLLYVRHASDVFGGVFQFVLGQGADPRVGDAKCFFDMVDEVLRTDKVDDLCKLEKTIAGVYYYCYIMTIEIII